MHTRIWFSPAFHTVRCRDPRSAAAAAQAGGAHAARHCAALVFLHPSGAVDVGSATCIRVGERYFLATAGHNLVGLGDDRSLHIVPPGGAGDVWLPFVGRRAAVERGPGAVDVGWIELEPTTARAAGFGFLDLEDLALGDAARPGGLYYLQGLPSRLVHHRPGNGGRRIRLTALGYLTSSLERALDPLADLLFTYDASRVGAVPGARPYLPPAHGLSGGGVWSLAREPATETRRHRPRLAGIIRSWHRGARHLRGVRIRHWLELVHDDFPDLRPLLEPVLDA